MCGHDRARASRHGSPRQMRSLGGNTIGRTSGGRGIPQEEVPSTSTDGGTWWPLARLTPDEGQSGMLCCIAILKQGESWVFARAEGAVEEKGDVQC